MESRSIAELRSICKQRGLKLNKQSKKEDYHIVLEEKKLALDAEEKKTAAEKAAAGLALEKKKLALKEKKALMAHQRSRKNWSGCQREPLSQLKMLAVTMKCVAKTDVPATVRTESGTESRFSLLADALSGRHGNIDAACLAGNPDIRVPETVKTDDGLRAARVVDERDAERHKEGTKEGPEKTEGRPTTREPRKPVVQDRIETGEEPEERELRHVPGGTWLNQVPFLTGDDSPVDSQAYRKKGTKGKPRPSRDVAVSARLLAAVSPPGTCFLGGNVRVPSPSFSALSSGVHLFLDSPGVFRRVLSVLLLLPAESVVHLYHLRNPEIRVHGAGVRPLAAMGTADAFLRRARTAPVGGDRSCVSR
ncbi:hypothetical protein NDU88_006463 [Pleurodeles waltl]|uniref:SAP domain-containing protein n=1 Tax=Pleurodeles waltl TaxID=8319 RepID=A0AAV7LAC5_PLEWA|nr:hypothetical protein NDU88_006463 [Pleurodeles waltl]